MITSPIAVQAGSVVSFFSISSKFFRFSRSVFGMLALLAVCWSPQIFAQTVAGTVTVGTNPFPIAVNPVTNKIYAGNQGSNNVTVFDGQTNTKTTISVGTTPVGVAVNPVTNKIYVANLTSNNVTVIDGVTNTTTAIAVGTAPQAVAVNSVTNKIYVGNRNSANVTVIDGATNTTTNVATGTLPGAIALNSATNKIYVTNQITNNVTVIDGATNTTVTVTVGTGPESLGVNPVTNRIYVANNTSGSVSVIDGATNIVTATVTVGSNPNTVGVNPVTNKIYTSNASTNNVTVIDGATNTPTNIAAGTNPLSAAVNPVTNKIYVANQGSNNVTVINGADNSTTTLTLAVGAVSVSAAVNPVTNKIYVANNGNGTVSIIDGATNNSVTANSSPGGFVKPMAFNPITNKIYLANTQVNLVDVIDGNTNALVTSIAANDPRFVGVNPVTNRIYIPNHGSNTVTVLNGADNSVITTVTVMTNPWIATVNPVTNKIYIGSDAGNTIRVIDGVTNIATSVTVGGQPMNIAVNPVTNRVYVSNRNSHNVSVINGATNAVITTVSGIGFFPDKIVVNPKTNKIYVNASEIDGANNTVTALSNVNGVVVGVNTSTNKVYYAFAGPSPFGGASVIDANNTATPAVQVAGWGNVRGYGYDPFNNKLYASDATASNLRIFDGSTNTISSRSVPTGAFSMANNPVTGKVYVTPDTNVLTVTNYAVVSPADEQAVPLVAAINPLVGNVSQTGRPLFGFGAASTFSPTAPSPRKVYYQIDNKQGAWTEAPVSGPGYAATLSPLLPGEHTVFAYATDGQDATNANTGRHNAPLTSNIVAYTFVVMSEGELAVSNVNSGSSPTYPAPFNVVVEARDAGVVQTVTRDTVVQLAVGTGTGALGGTTSCTILTGNSFCSVTGVTYNKAETGVILTASSTSGMVLSNANSAAFDVLKANQSITFNALANKTFGDAAFSVSGTGGASGNPVTFASQTASVCTTGGINGTTVTIVGAGTCTIRASQAGNANCNAASDVDRSFTVAQAGQAITFNPLSNKTFGDAAFTVSGTGGASGNPVTFTTTNASVCTATGSNGSTITIVSAGSCTVRAGQAGNTNYSAATNVDQSFSIAQASQVISFDPLGSKTFGDAAFTVSAIGGGSGNPVTFTTTNASICTATGTNGSTITIVSVGSCTVRASQAGNTNYTAAANVDQSFTIAQASQTILFDLLVNKTFGDAPFGVGATGGASGNPITFTSQTTSVCAISGATVTIVAVGNCGIRASQGGNSNFLAANDVDRAFTIAPASQVINFGALAGKTIGDAPFDVSATGGGSGNPVTFASQNTDVCTTTGTNGATVTILTGGTCTIRASQIGTISYSAAADVERSFTVATVGQSITFGTLGNKTLGDAAYDVSATGGASGNPVTFASQNTSVCTTSGTNGATVTLLATGTCTIRASQTGNSSYGPATDVDQSFTVAAAPITNKNVVMSVTPNPPVTGQPVVFTFTVTGTNPTGTVTIKDGNKVIGTIDIVNGTGLFSTTNLTAGSHTLTAEYGGDGSNPAGGSDPASVAVPVGGTLNPVSLGVSPSKPVDDKDLALTVHVDGTNPTGEVVFFDGTKEIGRATVVNGKATLKGFKLRAGKHNITAAYSGDGTNSAKTSAAAAVDVQSSGGGGCTINRSAGFDWSMLLLVLMAAGLRVARRVGKPA